MVARVSNRFFVAPLLILWISGAGCIFGCESSYAASPGGSIETASSTTPESCAAHRSHDCCVKKKVSDRRASSPNVEVARLIGLHSSNSTESCPLAINANAAVSKARSSDVAVATTQSFLQTTSSAEQLLRLSNVLPVLNRSGTHLRCCVFLI